MTTTRRQFLIDGLRVSAAVSLASSLGLAARRGRTGERVLVVLQLSGGNDGLNTVVPFHQDDYFRLRPTISLAKGGLHRLDDEHGLHPELGGLGELFSEGRVAVVHGVGYPNPDRSHFRSMEIWHTGDPEHPAGDVGWMGRLSDEIVGDRPGSLAALHVGSGDLPLALWARDAFAPSVVGDDAFRLEGEERFLVRREALLAGGSGGDELAFLRSAARTTYDAARRMERAAERDTALEYPGYGLARRLRLVAKLVTGGFDTRLFHLELGGFDTHARQAPAHADLLRELSASLTAFQRDLEAAGVADRVVTLVFSEFGRRAQENGSRGTDHGVGAPVLLVGSPVRGGLFGTPPDVTHLVDGDVPSTTDFRSIYGLLERNWLGLTPSSALAPPDLLRS